MECSMDCGEPVSVSGRPFGANCVDCHTFSDAHTCSRFCKIDHIFGNVYQCCQSGQTHVCDKNCTQRVVYDNLSTICRLSKKVFPLTPEELMDRGSRKRESGDQSTFCSPHRKRHSLTPTCSPQPLSPFGVHQQITPLAQMAGSPFGPAYMM